MTREEFEYAIKSCGFLIHRGHIYYEESELIKAFEDLGLTEQELCDHPDKCHECEKILTCTYYKQEPKYCDRNICLRNEYNGIGCDECEVTKSQEPSGDLIQRQAVDTLVDELARAISDERCCISRGRSTATIMQDILDLPSVKPQEPCDFAK